MFACRFEDARDLRHIAILLQVPAKDPHEPIREPLRRSEIHGKKTDNREQRKFLHEANKSSNRMRGARPVAAKSRIGIASRTQVSLAEGPMLFHRDFLLVCRRRSAGL